MFVLKLYLKKIFSLLFLFSLFLPYAAGDPAYE